MGNLLTRVVKAEIDTREGGLILSTWYKGIVIAFWLTTTAWLMVTKIVPPFVVGNPPSMRVILDSMDEESSLVGWDLRIGGKHIGWAINRFEKTSYGAQEFQTFVELRHLSLNSILSDAFSSMLKWRQPEDADDALSIELAIDSWTRLTIDTLGYPSHLITEFTVTDNALLGNGKMGDVPNFRIRLQGEVVGDTLQLDLSIGDFKYKRIFSIPRDAMITDSLAPMGELPGLRVGQSWTVPVFSPFQAGAERPMELLEARVTRMDTVVWEDMAVRCMVVELSEAGQQSLTSNRGIRGRSWVAPDGKVLKNELVLQNEPLTFERMPMSRAQELHKQIRLP